MSFGKRKDGKFYKKTGSSKTRKSGSIRSAGTKLKRKKQSINDLMDFSNPTIEDGRKEKEIMIGRETNGSGITLTLDFEGGYFSIHGDVFDINDAITEEEGESRARDSLEDGELWRMSVESENTTLSLDEWVEFVLNMDGWEHVLGDMKDIGNGLYVRESGGGQIDVSHKLKDWDKLMVEESDLRKIRKAWNDLHLVHFDKMNEKQKKQVFDTMNIFKKYSAFVDSDLSKLVGTN